MDRRATPTWYRQLEAAALGAIAWMKGPADIDSNGYLESRAHSPGLITVGWKDWPNSMLFADGRIAAHPIATCEIPGYAYDARRRSARLARAMWPTRPREPAGNRRRAAAGTVQRGLLGPVAEPLRAGPGRRQAAR